MNFVVNSVRGLFELLLQEPVKSNGPLFGRVINIVSSDILLEFFTLSMRVITVSDPLCQSPKNPFDQKESIGIFVKEPKIFQDAP